MISWSREFTMEALRSSFLHYILVTSCCCFKLLRFQFYNIWCFAPSICLPQMFLQHQQTISTPPTCFGLLKLHSAISAAWRHLWRYLYGSQKCTCNIYKLFILLLLPLAASTAPTCFGLLKLQFCNICCMAPSICLSKMYLPHVQTIHTASTASGCF